MDEAERGRRAQEKLNRGELPRLTPERIVLNDGVGEVCALCDESIPASATEYTLQFLLRFGFARTDVVSFRFHRLCYVTWLIERDR